MKIVVSANEESDSSKEATLVLLTQGLCCEKGLQSFRRDRVKADGAYKTLKIKMPAGLHKRFRMAALEKGMTSLELVEYLLDAVER